MRFLVRITYIFVLLITISTISIGQSGRTQRGGDAKKNTQPSATGTPAATPTPGPPTEVATPSMETQPVPANEPQDIESIKVQTNLVTVPVIVSDRNNIYVPDMRQDEFTIEENGVKQDLAFFASTTQPFHVVLMIDTSGSTSEKLAQIQRAATAFVDQLQPQDSIKLISFDDTIRQYGGFTNNRWVLRDAINRMRSGAGTKLYDAMTLAIKVLKPIDGRKAIVIFTDGVDWYSDDSSSGDNRRELEEMGIIVYPIRYDTRAETERIARQQQRNGQVVDLGSILSGGGSSGTTPPAVPGTTIPMPPSTGGGTPTIGGIPIPPIVIQPRNDPTRPNTDSSDTSIDAMLNSAYATADAYLIELADVTGGKLHRADTLGSLPVAFANIAAELRTQYSIGYYPANVARDGKFRKVKVRTTRSGVVVRARPGYRVPKK